MIDAFNIKTIDDVEIKNSQVLLKVDFNILNLHDGQSLEDKKRILDTMPTINKLLSGNNKLIVTSHVSDTSGPDPKRSTKPISEYFQTLVPKYKVIFVDDLMSDGLKKRCASQKSDEIIFLENTRFYPEEKKKSVAFAKRLASLANIYIYDAFGVSHRIDTTVVGVPLQIKTYAGVLMQDEVNKIMKGIQKPERPVVGIVGGAKIVSKVNAIEKLISLCDYVLVGGVIGNTFLSSDGFSMGKSTNSYEDIEHAREIYYQAGPLPVHIVLPKDVVIGDPDNPKSPSKVVTVENVPDTSYALDIGPVTRREFSDLIAKAKTIIWNGPMGLSEIPEYSEGTKSVYDAVVSNEGAYTLVGGGDTINAISGQVDNEKISHISTGGGATLTLIGKGTLPALEALKKSQEKFLH